MADWSAPRTPNPVTCDQAIFFFGGGNAKKTKSPDRRLPILQSLVRVPLWPLAGFVLGCLEFKSSATLVNSQLVASYQLGFLILRCLDNLFLII